MNDIAFANLNPNMLPTNLDKENQEYQAITKGYLAALKDNKNGLKIDSMLRGIFRTIWDKQIEETLNDLIDELNWSEKEEITSSDQQELIKRFETAISQKLIALMNSDNFTLKDNMGFNALIDFGNICLEFLSIWIVASSNMENSKIVADEDEIVKEILLAQESMRDKLIKNLNGESSIDNNFARTYSLKNKSTRTQQIFDKLFT